MRISAEHGYLPSTHATNQPHACRAEKGATASRKARFTAPPRHQALISCFFLATTSAAPARNLWGYFFCLQHIYTAPVSSGDGAVCQKSIPRGLKWGRHLEPHERFSAPILGPCSAQKVTSIDERRTTVIVLQTSALVLEMVKKAKKVSPRVACLTAVQLILERIL